MAANGKTMQPSVRRAVLFPTFQSSGHSLLPMRSAPAFKPDDESLAFTYRSGVDEPRPVQLS